MTCMCMHRMYRPTHTHTPKSCIRTHQEHSSSFISSACLQYVHASDGIHMYVHTYMYTYRHMHTYPHKILHVPSMCTPPMVCTCIYTPIHIRRHMHTYPHKNPACSQHVYTSDGIQLVCMHVFHTYVRRYLRIPVVWMFSDMYVCVSTHAHDEIYVCAYIPVLVLTRRYY